MGKTKDNENIIPEDDYEYEKKLAEQEQLKKKTQEEAYLEAQEKQRRAEREEREERDRRIAQEKVELMKLKNGVIDESDTIKEEHDEIRKLHGWEKVSNFWYHNKVWILFTAFIASVVIFIVYDTVTREKPDLTVMMIANNGLSLRQDELEEFFEKYTDDLNGDGKVHVSVLIMPLDSNSTSVDQQSYQSKFLAQLQSCESIMVITDSNTNPDFLEIMKSDLSKDFPGNPYIDEYGLSLNFGFLAEEFKFEYMPNDVHLSMRIPINTVSDSLEDMEKSYDVSFKVFSRIVEDLTKRAEETNDQGLSTEPIKQEESSAAEG